MFCRFCGKEVQDGQKFCPYCGKKGDVDNCISQPVSKVVPTPAFVTNAVPVQQSVVIAPAEQKKKKSKLPIIIIALVLVAAIVAGVIFLPGLLNKAEKNNPEENGDGVVWVLSKYRVDYYGDKYSIDFEYNEKGLVDKVERVYTYSDGVVEKCLIEIKYDENDRITEEIECWEGDSAEHTYYRYDQAGNLTEKEYGDWIEVYEYDENGVAIEMYEYVNGELENHMLLTAEEDDIGRYEYDSQNRIIKEYEYYDGEKVVITEYKYNDDGKICESEYKSDYVRYIFEYDANGNLIRRKTIETGYDGSEYIAETTFEYVAVETEPESEEAVKAMQNEILRNLLYGSVHEYYYS